MFRNKICKHFTWKVIIQLSNSSEPFRYQIVFYGKNNLSGAFLHTKIFELFYTFNLIKYIKNNIHDTTKKKATIIFIVNFMSSMPKIKLSPHLCKNTKLHLPETEVL